MLRFPAVVLVAAAALAGGCGRGVVHTIPVARADLPAREPLIQTLPIHEACYWLDAQGRVHIALRYHQGSLLGPMFRAEWLMSLVLERLPAGRERLYQLTTQNLRMVQTKGLDRRRGRSFSGVAVLSAPRGGVLRGRFHTSVPQQVFSALGGWGGAHRGPLVILAGEFEAVNRPERGQAIEAQTEADDFGREPTKESPRSASRPHTQPAGAPGS